MVNLAPYQLISRNLVGSKVRLVTRQYVHVGSLADKPTRAEIGCWSIIVQ